MKGRPCHLTVKKGSIPVHASRPRPVSEPLLPPTIKELQFQIRQGLLRKAKGTTDWMHSMVVAMKKPAFARLKLKKKIAAAKFYYFHSHP